MRNCLLILYVTTFQCSWKNGSVTVLQVYSGTKTHRLLSASRDTRHRNNAAHHLQREVPGTRCPCCTGEICYLCLSSLLANYFLYSLVTTLLFPEFNTGREVVTLIVISASEPSMFLISLISFCLNDSCTASLSDVHKVSTYFLASFCVNCH